MPSRLMSAVGAQLRHPSGWSGRLIASAMAVANSQSNCIAVRALKVEPGDTVLELGCGGGRALRDLSAIAVQGRVFGIDHSASMLAQAARRNREAIRRGRVHLLRGRFETLPWRDESIDKILAVHVVYFADASSINEARRVLRPCGRLVILAADKLVMQRWHFEQTHHLFYAPELASLLARGGFAANKIALSRVELAPGVPGLLATATKTATI